MPTFVTVRSKVAGGVGARRTGAVVGLVVAGSLALAACLPPKPPAPKPPVKDATTAPARITVPAGPTGPLPAPPWWAGDCDATNYPGAHALGASYRGVAVCGPRPGADHVPDRLVRFYNGAWGEQEWECVELAMRYMYLAYGVSPYNANGKDVYANYTTAAGGGLVKVADGTAGVPPAPGDVITFGPLAATPLGHVGVVESVAIDTNGNGTVRILTQNDTVDGWRTLAIHAWSVDGTTAGVGPTVGWLHKPS
jgi:CHAP domain-containing protein